MADTITFRYIPTPRLIGILSELPSETAICRTAYTDNFAILEFNAAGEFRSMGHIDLREETVDITEEADRFDWDSHAPGEI